MLFFTMPTEFQVVYVLCSLVFSKLTPVCFALEIKKSEACEKYSDCGKDF